MSGPDIFISYCRQDRPAARLFAESLAGEGFNVWWDAVMHSGETFDEVIERNLRAAKAVVVLWSPRSVASRWVRAEATQADRANKLVPVIIEPCERPIIFELTHTADLPDWKGDRSDPSWRSLVNDLRRLVGPAKDAPAQASPEAGPAVTEAPPAPIVAPATEKELQTPKVEAREKSELAANDEELAKALERLAAKRRSVLNEPTPAEDAQAKFFKQSDEFRQIESERLHCLRRIHAIDGEAPQVVGPGGLKIGRTRPADIIIPDPSVSREHCVVELAADKLRVIDLNSTNGTYIDNKRVGRAEILPVGSILRVGNVSFEHEVRSRTEVERRDGTFEFNRGTDPRQSRIASSS